MSARSETPSKRLENERLRSRLLEVEETLRAIRTGEVDALVVETEGEDQVFTLQGADQTYRLIVEQMQKGAAILSEGGVVLYCNPFLAALLGAPLEKVTGASLSSFLDEATDAYFSRLREAATGGVSRGEIAFQTSRGPVLTQISITVLALSSGVLHCVIVTDLTERKRREEERLLLEHALVARATAEELNRMARIEIERRTRVEECLLLAEMDRTRLLARERLARADAEEANRLKDEFLATLSHELRTPVSAILTWAHVLRQTMLDPGVLARAAEAIERNARAQSALVASLLDVSRIVTGKFQISVGPVSLAEVIDAAAESLRSAAQIKNVAIEIVIAPGVGVVRGDAPRLVQVMWNLLSNAVRLAPLGGRVEVLVACADSAVEIRVADDGSGIDPAFLPFMFEHFRQGDSSSTRRHRGLGLGLALVRHLVELHGGSVEARNREGVPGAVFVVRLPGSIESAPGNPLRPPPPEPERL